MNANDITRYSKKLVQYFWDPLPVNESSEAVWCLGIRYESRPIRSPRQRPQDAAAPQDSKGKETDIDVSSLDIIERTETAERDEALEKGWPGPLIDDIEARIWLTYRNNFTPIAKSSDPSAASAMSFATRLKQMANQGGFTSDTGWGCMIRSGQSLLANALATSQLGREWRRGEKADEEKSLLALFADDESAPFSVHRFVQHGAAACGKHPGEWFGPSATARCIQALASAHTASNLLVYARPDDADVYADSFLTLAHSRGGFTPTLILLGTRLGIDRINPVYYPALSRILASSTSVGIAGGRPSSSHYFFGVQGQANYFYLDPHHTRPMLHRDPSLEDIASCHTRRLRRIGVEEMDPSMLLGFLIRSQQEWEEWRAWVAEEAKRGKGIVHVHEHETRVDGNTSGERPGAVDEVMSCDDDSDGETVVS